MTLFVNNDEIDDQLIQREADRMRPHHEKTFPDLESDERDKQLQQWARENTIEQVLLNQAALQEIDSPDPEQVDKAFDDLLEQHGGREKFFERFKFTDDQEPTLRKEIETQMCIEELLKKITRSVSPPTEQEVRTYYDRNPDRFKGPETVRASHIVKHLQPGSDDKALRVQMEGVLNKLRGGADFSEMARQYSDCPDKGGDLGTFPRGRMVPNFERVIFKMNVGQISDVFTTQLGYHIATVTEKQSPDSLPFEQVRNPIARQLAQQRRREAIDAFVDEKKKQATIEDK